MRIWCSWKIILKSILEVGGLLMESSERLFKIGVQNWSSIWLIYLIGQRSSFIILFPWLFSLFRFYFRRRSTRTAIRRTATRRRIRSFLISLLNLLTILSSSSELSDLYLLERSLSDELDEDDELYDLRLLLISHNVPSSFFTILRTVILP